MGFAWIDITIVLVMLISIGIGAFRGFTREALSLATWIMASVLSITLAGKLAPMLSDSIETPQFRIAIAMAILFVLSMVAGGLITFLMMGLLQASHLQGIDRSIGIVFGLLRGVIVISILVMCGVFSNIHHASWWQESSLLPYFTTLLHWLKNVMPSDIAQYILV